MKPKAAKEQRRLAADSLRQARHYKKAGLLRAYVKADTAFKFHRDMALALGWTRFNVPMKG